MRQDIEHALEVVAGGGMRLRTVWHFDWPAFAQQAVYRLRLGKAGEDLPPLVAVMGGASSGKSTVFNNLLGGHLVSRITAKGHATLGPILAVHEDHRPAVEQLLDDDRLLPGLRREPVGVEDNVAGDPEAVAVVVHTVDTLRDVFLLDMPDFTSQAASREGDVAMALMPWFDRLIVVVDHERWFDRQSISELRTCSARFGQERFVLFNRTLEGELAEEDRARLAGQADRLGATAMDILAFRRGRGFCQFAPGTLDAVYAFMSGEKKDRRPALISQAGESANRVLNQNDERAARLARLKASLAGLAERTVPTTTACLTALMTAPERDQMTYAARVLRLHETKQWLSDQTHRLQAALKRVPVVGAMVPGGGGANSEAATGTDRQAIGEAYFEASARRQAHEVQRLVHASAFWDEVRRWTGLEPSDYAFTWDDDTRAGVRADVAALDRALAAWMAKVESECQGLGPHVQGALGVGAVGLALVLIAVPGPVTALTLLSAQSAIGAAFGKLLAGAGAGAMFGKQLKGLKAVIREKLLSSPQFDAVNAAADAFRGRLMLVGENMVGSAIDEAGALVMSGEEPLAAALACLRDQTENAQ